MRDDFSRAKFMFLHSLDPLQTIAFTENSRSPSYSSDANVSV